MKIFSKSTLHQFLNPPTPLTSRRPFYISCLIMLLINVKKVKNSWPWATFLTLSLNAIFTPKLFITGALFKSVSIHSSGENTTKFNSSCQKYADMAMVKLETRPRMWSDNFWHKGISEDSNKRKFLRTRFSLTIFIWMLNLLSHLNSSPQWYWKFHTLWPKVEKLLQKLSEEFTMNMNDQ